MNRDGARKKTPRSTKPEVSSALTNALSHVKEFMSETIKAQTMLREGKIAMDKGDIRGAIDIFGHGLSYNPMLIGFYQNRASCYKTLGMLSEAYFDYSFMIRLEPDSGSHYCLRSLILAKMKKYSLAIEDSDYAVELDPTPFHLYSRATIYADRGQPERAVEDFTRALADSTIHPDLKSKCLCRRSLASFEIGSYESSINDSAVVLMSEPNHVGARALMGRALKMLGELRKAEEQLTHVITMESDQPQHYVERADIRFRMQEKNKAIESVYDLDFAVRLLEVKISKAADPGKKKLVANLRSTTAAATITTISEEALINSVAGTSGFAETSTTKLSVDANPESVSDVSTMGMVAMSSSQPSELEEQMADALYRRAQAKLMIDCYNHDIRAPDGLVLGNASVIHRRPPEIAVLEASLQDALRAVACNPADDDFQVLAANCYIRLHRLKEAERHLRIVTERTSTNYRAQFQLAYCLQEEGKKRDAIEGITKIIASSQRSIVSSGPGPVSAAVLAALPPHLAAQNTSMVPLGRLYESRGTLFHEIQVHKLALTDLGRAIALDPTKADNYFLRGDCHCKMGNYEQAMEDFYLAEAKGFHDRYSLFATRGAVLRMLGRAPEACQDFEKAIQSMDSENKGAVLRVVTLLVLSLIDQQLYSQALSLCLNSLETVREIVEDHLDIIRQQQILHQIQQEEMIAAAAAAAATKLSAKLSKKNQDTSSSNQLQQGSVASVSSRSVSPGGLSETSSLILPVLVSPFTPPPINTVPGMPHSPARAVKAASGKYSPVKKPQSPSEYARTKERKKAEFESELPLTLPVARKLEWILNYHVGLCLFNQGHYRSSVETLEFCIHPSNSLYSSDEHSLDMVKFFMSLSLNALDDLPRAEELMRQVLDSNWAAAEGKRDICMFVLGKQCQRQGRHAEAVDCFSETITLDPSQPHAYFRRAWSYKSLGNFEAAGSDFETAKNLRIDDPNFSVDYKTISKCEFMEIDSEPDLIMLFPPMLPAPGSI